MNISFRNNVCYSEIMLIIRAQQQLVASFFYATTYFQDINSRAIREKSLLQNDAGIASD